ncbi:MAG: phosphomannomutase [Pseudomonadota bacterium]
MQITSFKAYDVRGRIPDQLNAEIAYRIGNAVVEYLGAKRVVVGRDIRASSAELCDAVVRGINEAGADAIDIGLGGTEMVYFATAALGADGGIMVTASHNPKDYNGLKIVREDAKPISGDSGLTDIRELAERDHRHVGERVGSVESVDIMAAYCETLLSFVAIDELRPLKIVVNPGNGGAGLVVDALQSKLPFDFVKLHYEPDGSFPNGVPNPMLPANRTATADAVIASGAAIGIAWDGDFDRCFFFDHNGRFVDGYYIVGLLAEAMLARAPSDRIVYDPRVIWSTEEVVERLGGTPVMSKSGHSFIKEVMRREDAVYGGEMSAHHYFRDFFYADTGMVPWLLVASIISVTGKSLAELVDERIAAFPTSGEINRKVDDVDETIQRVREHYEASADGVVTIDGVSLSFSEWRFNLRASNTEPVIRLNVESRGDAELMQAKTAELLELIGGEA